MDKERFLGYHPRGYREKNRKPSLMLPLSTFLVFPGTYSHMHLPLLSGLHFKERPSN